VNSDYTPQQVAELMKGGAVELIDVRETDEYAAGRIAGSRHIPLGEVSAAADTINRQSQVVFYCRSGARSAMAAEAFAAAGWDAHNLAGGLLDWQAAGLPLDPSDGRVA
jgi:rhodanese-related sulfurtransferase